jgi:hypothetical protein
MNIISVAAKKTGFFQKFSSFLNFRQNNPTGVFQCETSIAMLKM